MSRTDFYALIPEFQEWGDLNGHPFDPEAWLGGVGSFELAVAFSVLFWPELIEHDDCVFVGQRPDDDNYQSWMKTLDGDRSRVEAVLNHLHLADLFDGRPVTSVQLEYLGPRLAEMWLAKARREFPSRTFDTEFLRGDDDALRDYQITLFQSTTS